MILHALCPIGNGLFQPGIEQGSAFVVERGVGVDEGLWPKDEIKGMRFKIGDVIVDVGKQFEELSQATGEADWNGSKKDV